MSTECNQFIFGLHPQKRREIRAQFDGGAITSDGGGLLLREVEKRIGVLHQFAACFTDYRNPDLIEHQVEEMVAQRVYGLALGYEDLNDHEELRNDPLLAVLVEKSDPSQEALSGKSTLNRLELTRETASQKERYKKIVLDHGAVDRLLVDIFLQAHREEPKEIILDLDATDDPLHGHQEGRFFHGYYGHYCYLPLYIFCGEFLLCARLRPSNIDASAGSVEELKRIVAQIRAAWPQVRLVVRGDSGFCREELMAWCEAEGVDYLLGLAKNERLKAEITQEQKEAQARYQETGRAARLFKEFVYQTRKSWSRARRDMENRIKEQLMLFSDRTSTHYLRSNQLRLYFSSIAYVLLQMLRRLGLAGTELAQAQCNTIRLKLLKIGALIRITVRKVWISLAGGYPFVALFQQVYEKLRAVPVKY